MKAKTYKGRTIQDALDQIKRELGSEAVILSTQTIMRRRAFGLLQQRQEAASDIRDSILGTRPHQAGPC